MNNMANNEINHVTNNKNSSPNEYELKDLLNIDIKSIPKEHAYTIAEKLREEINKHNYYYYIKDNPIISDAEYDQLLKIFLSLK